MVDYTPVWAFVAVASFLIAIALYMGGSDDMDGY